MTADLTRHRRSLVGVSWATITLALLHPFGVTLSVPNLEGLPPIAIWFVLLVVLIYLYTMFLVTSRDHEIQIRTTENITSMTHNRRSKLRKDLGGFFDETFPNLSAWFAFALIGVMVVRGIGLGTFATG